MGAMLQDVAQEHRVPATVRLIQLHGVPDLKVTGGEQLPAGVHEPRREVQAPVLNVPAQQVLIGTARPAAHVQ